MLQILTRFASFIGFVIIGLSWIIDNMLLTQLQQQTQLLDLVESERQQVQLLANQTQDQQALQWQLLRMEQSLNRLQQETLQEEAVLSELEANQKWVDLLKTDLKALVRNAEGLERLGGIGKLNDSLSNAILHSCRAAKKINSTMISLLIAYDEQTSEARQYLKSVTSEESDTNHESDYSQDSDTRQEQLEAIKQKQDALIVEIEESLHPFDMHNTHLLTLYDRVDAEVMQRREESLLQEQAVSQLAYFCYGLGTALIGLHKWLETRLKESKEKEDQQLALTH